MKRFVGALIRNSKPFLGKHQLGSHQFATERKIIQNTQRRQLTTTSYSLFKNDQESPQFLGPIYSQRSYGAVPSFNNCTAGRHIENLSGPSTTYAKRLFHSSPAAYQKSFNTSNLSRKLLPDDELTSKQARLVMHFLHSSRGTSVLLHIVQGNRFGNTCDETVFLKMYSSNSNNDSDSDSDSDSDNEENEAENSHHAEKQLCEDLDNVVKIIRSKMSRDTDKILKLTLFQSNSPCALCSKDLVKFNREFQNIFESTSFKMQVQHIYQIRNDENIEELCKLYDSGMSVEKINWHDFYDSFSHWVWSSQKFSSSQPCIDVDGKLSNETNVVNHLYEKAQTFVVGSKLRQSRQVQRDINTLIKNTKLCESEDELVQQSYLKSLHWAIDESVENDDKIKKLLSTEQKRLKSRIKCVKITGIPDNTDHTDLELVNMLLHVTGLPFNHFPKTTKRTEGKGYGNVKNIRVYLPSLEAKRLVLKNSRKFKSVNGLPFDTKNVFIYDERTVLQNLADGFLPYNSHHESTRKQED